MEYSCGFDFDICKSKEVGENDTLRAYPAFTFWDRRICSKPLTLTPILVTSSLALVSRQSRKTDYPDGFVWG